MKRVMQIIGEEHAVTFREQAKVYVDRKMTRDCPVAPSTPETWECALKNWINPIIGDMPLSQVNNFAMRDLVAAMKKGGLVGGVKRKPFGREVYRQLHAACKGRGGLSNR